MYGFDKDGSTVKVEASQAVTTNTDAGEDGNPVSTTTGGKETTTEGKETITETPGENAEPSTDRGEAAFDFADETKLGNWADTPAAPADPANSWAPPEFRPSGNAYHVVRNSAAENGEPQLQKKRGALLSWRFQNVKTKRILSLVLALIMALAMAVPAMAAGTNASKIEDPDPRKPIVEAGAAIDTAAYDEIYVKQATEAAIWVPTGDTRTDAEIIESAKEHDPSMSGGTDRYFIIRGDGDAMLHGATRVTAKGGILTVNGKISHVTFVGAPAPEFPEDDGKVSAVFQINKFLNEIGNPGVGYTFEIIAEDGTVVGTMTSDANGEAVVEIKVDPGTYIIREKLPTNEKYAYEDVADITVTVDGSSDEAVFSEDYEGYVLNIQKGKLDVNIGDVVQQYVKQVHEDEYKLYSEGTLVSHIASVSGAALPAGITGDYLKNGMTYLTINRAALEAAGEDGVNIGIATSDPQKGNKKSWNTPAPAPLGETEQPSYNLKIKDGKLVVTSDLPNIGVCLYSAKGTVNGPKDVKHLTGVTTASYAIPAGSTFKFFLHIEDTEYYTNELIGCKLVSSETLEQAFVCEPTIVVTDAEDNVVDASKDLSAGAYTVTVSIEETGDTWTETVTVNPGETTEVDFGKLTVSEMGETVIECPQNCGICK